MVLNNLSLTNGNIIDVESGEIYQGSIVIKDGYIEKVISGKLESPITKDVVDVSGQYIIPGLIDMHCHIKEQFAPQFVASGITTVRNTGGSLPLIKDLIEASIDAPTPRVYSAGSLIDGPPGLWGPTSEGNFVTDSPSEAREEVKRQVAAGAKFIKVYGWLPKDVMEAVTDEAKIHRMEVSCDILHSTTVNALDAAQMGIKWFEHATGFVQTLYPNWNTQADAKEWGKINWENPDIERISRLCEKMLEFDVKLCPTLIIQDQIERFPNHWFLDNDLTKSLEGKGGLMELWQGFTEHAELFKQQIGIQNKYIKAITKAYFDLGGTVVAGTDTPGGFYTFPGMGLHRELEILVEIGLTELEAIQAATVNAAKSIQLDELGSIKEGKIADLIVLDENPLKDIRHTKEIHAIVKGGKQYKQEEISKNYIVN